MSGEADRMDEGDSVLGDAASLTLAVVTLLAPAEGADGGGGAG